MPKKYTILFDLDGVLTNTMHHEYDVYRDGKQDANVSNIPLFSGAQKVVSDLKEKGHQVFIVSDSHPRFVNPIASQLFGVEALSLAYKPTIEKIKEFIDEKSEIKLPSNRIFMVGDTHLDIVTARKLKVSSIQMVHSADFKPEVWAITQKYGPTFSCKNFDELENIFDNMLENLLCIEGTPYSKTCKGYISINEIDYKSHVNKRLYPISLARQDVGPCDIFAKGDWYARFGSSERTDYFLNEMAESVSNFIQHFQDKKGINFDFLSYVPDKSTTVPPQKMQHFVEMINCSIPIIKTASWNGEVNGSIRNEARRFNRYAFVKKYVEIDSNKNIENKNVIVIDDQLTTGATMEAFTDMLWEKGVNHILFITLFRMLNEVASEKRCPQCGKEMSIKNRKSDGRRFYSCTPERFGGVGCGNIENIE